MTSEPHTYDPELPHQPCKLCGSPFNPRLSWQNFGSVDCRKEYHKNQQAMMRAFYKTNNPSPLVESSVHTSFELSSTKILTHRALGKKSETI